MKNTSKIFVTIIIIVVFLILFTVIVGTQSNGGKTTPGILGLIVFAGMVGGIKAVWKSTK